MTDLIEVVQKQSLDSELIHLFELTLSDGTILYFHPDYDMSNTTTNQKGYIYFRDRTSPYTVRNYVPFPIEMSGADFQADGAITRPTLTVANVTSAFTDALDGFVNDDLIGQTITKRTTLYKYLYGQPGDASPPVEFPVQKYIIDRIEDENPLSITFELAPPFDLSGVKLPGRMVLGKYCSWQYQGNELSSCGGCRWSKNSKPTLPMPGDTSGQFKAYFTEKDEPIVSSNMFSTDSSINPSFNPNSYSYSVGDTIYTSDATGAVWMCKVAHTSTTWSLSYYQTNWDLIAHLTWAPSTAYYVNNYVKNGTDYYRCNTQHTSGTFSTDSAKWDRIYIYTTYSQYASYSAGDYVEYDNGTQTTIWKSLVTPNENHTPSESVYWTRGDKCGKKLSSCKSRFQFIPRHSYSTNNSTPKVQKDTTASLPFGAFPGAGKFR